jgi:hypothetical protein
MMGPNMQLPRFDQQLQEGRSFRPAAGSGLGQVRLHMAGGAFNRPQFVGQQIPAQPELAQAQPAQQQKQPPPPETQPPPPPPESGEPEVQRHPATRLAWGRLKKKDAAELAAALADIIARMRAKNIPPGMVAQIQARLANFSATAPETADVEITEHEVQRMESEILALEEAEKTPDSSNGSNWLIAVGAAIGLGLLIDALS